MAAINISSTPHLNSTCHASTFANTTDTVVAEGFENHIRIIVPVIFGLVMVPGLIGNSLVIIVVATNKRMRTTPNILVLNLAVADLCFIVFCVPFATVSLTTWYFEEMWCKFSKYSAYVSCYASVYTLVVMSFDRYIAILRPISTVSRGVTMKIILVKWLVILVGNTPILIESTVYEHCFNGRWRYICIIAFTDTSSKIYFGCFFVFGYVLPLTLICIIYGIILKTLLQSKPPGESHAREIHTKKKRAAYMVVAVVIVFAVCWMPIQVIFMIQVFGVFPSNRLSVSIDFVAKVLSYTNSCVNPILYTFLSSNFRQKFRAIICFKK